MVQVLKGYIDDTQGAVTADWVVMTGAAMGLALAVLGQVSGGLENASSDISAALGGLQDTDAADYTANYFYDLGIAQYPNNQADAWRAARQQVDLASPTGYNYDTNFRDTRYVDNSTGYPIYESNDGLYYSIGGVITSKSSYDNTGRTSFKNAFDANWRATH